MHEEGRTDSIRRKMTVGVFVCVSISVHLHSESLHPFFTPPRLRHLLTYTALLPYI